MGPAPSDLHGNGQQSLPVQRRRRGGRILLRPIGHHGALAVGWCLVIGLVGFVWAKHLVNRDPTATARTILSAGGH